VSHAASKCSLIPNTSQSYADPRSIGQNHCVEVLAAEAYFRVDALLRQLADPNLHDIPRNLPFRVEMWDQSDQHIRWVIAASASVAIGHAALDAAIANYPDQRFTLRNGILVIRQHPRT